MPTLTTETNPGTAVWSNYILIDGSITTPAPVGAIVYNTANNRLYRQTASPSGTTYVAIGSGGGGGVPFIGATSTTNGAEGLVPQPLAGEQDHVLAGDGTWTDTVNVDSVTANTIVSADFNMARGEARNTLIETKGGGLVICDRNTGKFYRVLTEEIPPLEDWTPSDGQPPHTPTTQEEP